MLLHLLIKLLFVYIVSCSSPDVVKVNSEENHLQNHKDDNLDVNFNSKSSNFNADAGFRNGAANTFSKEGDFGKYSAIDENKNHHLDKSNYADQNYNQNEGGSLSDTNKKSAQKKGHHKSGFHNTYHKDESSSKSSYYDDNDEEGGDYYKNSNKGSFGAAKSYGDQGSHIDDSFKSKENRERVEHDNGKSHHNNAEDNTNYNRDNYNRNNENVGKTRDGVYDKASNNYYQDRYYQQNPYNSHNIPRNYNHRILYNSYNYPEKSTITIYEDPRVYQHKNYPDSLSSEHSRYHDHNNFDRVRLNIVPPFRRDDFRYENVKPVYDYDYV